MPWAVAENHQLGEFRPFGASQVQRHTSKYLNHKNIQAIVLGDLASCVPLS